jgi:hypothetical protein
MSQPTDQQRGSRGPRKDRGALRIGVWLASYLLLASARCTFPEYNYDDNAAGNVGVAGASAGSATGGSSAAVAGAGATTPMGGSNNGLGGAGPADGGDGGMGVDPDCAAPQWPVDRCAASCVRRYLDHCYDGELSEGEIGVDCGGDCQRCTLEACTTGSDCLSGSCEATGSRIACLAPLSIKFTQHEQSTQVGSTTWSITLIDGETSGQEFTFKDLKVRYYFDRSGIVEPLLVRATQSNLKLLNGESSGLAASWTVQRVEHLADTAYDAYVEVGFTAGGRLFPGDQIDLYQQMLTGDTGRSLFDQRANYSFTKELDAPWLHVAVFYRDELVWGLEPRPANPHACFARGVNLNGPPVTVDGKPWQSGSQAMVTTSGSGVSQSTVPFPVVTGGLATMLNTATRLQTDAELNLPTDNGAYLLYLYATSPVTDADASLLTVQGVAPESSGAFRSQATDGGQAWARLGPYRLDVTTGKVTVAVTKGTVQLAGMELWYPE